MAKFYFSLPLLLISIVPFTALAEENPSASTVLAAQSAKEQTVVLTVDQYSESVPQNILDSWVSRQNVFSLDPKAKSEFENTAYCPVNKILCALTLTNAQRQHLRLFPDTTLNTEAISSYVEDLARKVNRDPLDAKFKVEDGKVTTFSEAQTGITLDVPKSITVISDSLRQPPVNSVQTISLPFAVKKPELGYADVNNLGISSLIGEGTSNFKGSPANRIHNIKVAIERFNGVLIKPGEEFSFVKNLGDVDGDHGYLPELVIKQGVTEPEFGGGICQVSTTTFRAAIYSGLKITARRNHAYPVSYYNPQGMDATVYVPQPDLKFINNTPGYILIQTKIEGTILTFDFYGTSDGRKITVDGPTITERQPDGALKATFTQHVFDKDGKEFITDVFNSSYNSPYKYPHPGGPTLATKPSNWSNDEWKAYQKTLKDMAKTTAKKP
jgi:vancomycin resistance protein YoaR